MGSPRRRPRTAPLLCALTLLAAPAAAQPDPEDGDRVDAADLDLAAEADLRFQRGVALQQEGRYAEALEHYLLSQRLVSNRNVAFNIAVCFEALERFDLAYRYFDQYRLEARDAEERRAADDALTRIAPRVAVLHVTSEPPGAEVYLDRVDLGLRGRTPLDLPVDAGTHRILLRLEGYVPAEAAAEAVVGETRDVDAALRPIVGFVELSGEPAEASVVVDGTPAGGLPARLPLAPGLRVIEISAPDYATSRLEVTVTPNGTVRRTVRLERRTGSLLVDASERGAQVEVDGVVVDFTPAVLEAIPAGGHRVTISAPGFETVSREVAIRPDTQARVDVRLRVEREIQAASRRPQSSLDAPASVSAISLQEIEAFGYQTVSEALLGQRGVYPTHDRAYRSLGLRGVSQPQDYGNRLLVLLDGHTMNDDLLGSSYVGFDARTDLMDLRRIELVRGPGSALYGSSAFFGVINLVPRDADSLLQPHASLAVQDVRQARVRTGGGVRFGRDRGFLASAGGLVGQGEDILWPDLAEAAGLEDDVIRGADGVAAGGFYGRFFWDAWTVQASYQLHRKRLPNGAFDSIVGDPAARNTDGRGFLEVRWEPVVIPDELNLYLRAYVDQYSYLGDSPREGEGGAAPTRLDVRHTGVWIGAEARAEWAPLDWLRLTAGVDGRLSLLSDLEVFDRGEPDAPNPISDEADSGFGLFAAYLRSEFPLTDWLRFDLGARIDVFTTVSAEEVNPRGAAVVRPWEGGVLKLMGGSAFRAPSIYELYYTDGATQRAPPREGEDALRPEKIWTTELELTQLITDELAVTASGYFNQVQRFIELQTVDARLQFRNSPEDLQSLGLEVELRREWAQGWMAAVSYSVQRTRVGELFGPDISGSNLVPNSPEHLLGVRGAAPLVRDRLTLAGRLRVESRRLDRAPDGSLQPQPEVPVVADLTLSGSFPEIGLRYALGVRNLLDWRFSLPAGEDIRVPFVPQVGRTFFLSTTLELR